MPDLNSLQVPSLKARVHQHLSAAFCASLPLSELRFRPLQVSDLDEMVALHTEWFPLAYDEAFYDKSVKGELFTLAATYTGGPSQCGGSTSSSSCGVAAAEVERAQDKGREEHLLGMITMSTSCDHHREDIAHVLSGDCETICSRHRARKAPCGCDQDESQCDQANSQGCLAYILTLGVADCFRRRGLARELLRQALTHLEINMPEVQAIYLHVVDYNDAAICLYQSMGFLRINQFPQFYFLHGKHYDSFLYAHYLQNVRPPWKLWFRNLLGLASWRDWVVSGWRSLWRQDGLCDKPENTTSEP